MLESLFNKVVDLQVCNFTKKETPAQVFSCEYLKIKKKNTYFQEHLQVAASGDLKEFNDTAKRIIVTAQALRN